MQTTTKTDSLPTPEQLPDQLNTKTKWQNEGTIKLVPIKSNVWSDQEIIKKLNIKQ